MNGNCVEIPKICRQLTGPLPHHLFIPNESCPNDYFLFVRSCLFSAGLRVRLCQPLMCVTLSFSTASGSTFTRAVLSFRWTVTSAHLVRTKWSTSAATRTSQSQRRWPNQRLPQVQREFESIRARIIISFATIFFLIFLDFCCMFWIVCFCRLPNAGSVCRINFETIAIPKWQATRRNARCCLQGQLSLIFVSDFLSRSRGSSRPHLKSEERRLSDNYQQAVTEPKWKWRRLRIRKKALSFCTLSLKIGRNRISIVLRALRFFE